MAREAPYDAATMAEDERKTLEQRETGRGALRGLYLGEAAAIGHKRAEALREAEEQLDRLARLLPNAVDAGIALAEIARVADVSRPTLYQLRARYSDRPVDLRLGVLHAAAQGGMTTKDIAESLQRPVAEIEAVLNELQEKELMDAEPVEYLDGSGSGWMWSVRLAAFEALGEWAFDRALDNPEAHG
jgi:hypothetical protein